MTIFFIGSCAIGSYIKKLRTSPNFCKFLPWETFVIWMWHFHNTIIFVSRQHDVGISLSFFIKSNSLPLDFITDLLKICWDISKMKNIWKWFTYVLRNSFLSYQSCIKYAHCQIIFIVVIIVTHRFSHLADMYEIS